MINFVDSVTRAEIFTLELRDEKGSILVTFTLVTFTPVTFCPVTLAFSNLFLMFSLVKAELFLKITLVSATTLPLENDRTTALINPSVLE